MRRQHPVLAERFASVLAPAPCGGPPFRCEKIRLLRGTKNPACVIPLTYLASHEGTTPQSWWAQRDQGFEPFVSPLVIAEIARGDVTAAAMRLTLCTGLPRLDVNADAESLAKRLLVDGAIPGTEPEDALHVAIAVVHQLDYIATWNFVHLVGASAKFKLQMHISRMGYTPPIIATPEELLEELS